MYYIGFTDKIDHLDLARVFYLNLFDGISFVTERSVQPKDERFMSNKVDMFLSKIIAFTYLCQAINFTHSTLLVVTHLSVKIYPKIKREREIFEAKYLTHAASE